MVLSIEAKQVGPGRWEAYTGNGRERTGVDVVEWVKRGVALGAGEVLLTSVDKEGTRKGFDVALVRAVTEGISVPVIASGGMGTPEDLIDLVANGKADALAMAYILHYGRAMIDEIRSVAESVGTEIRDSALTCCNRNRLRDRQSAERASWPGVLRGTRDVDE